ncbi:capsular polysaccharide synthesis protein [Paragemmobacter ruber]|uniref:Capsular polysaccharide synthesis protein n=1 Tax=Paragemmobacter ruber TaxID=1985673 RepID=A0ABW9Y8F3_9RHOB|nr:capsular polysaccharide synthesis protein [Rhodobacter ruber]NBE08652.1 hypothetical protein [Rhodobacter ruber]
MDIFSFWDSGRQNAPAAVQTCLSRWEEMNPEHRLVVLDARDMADLLSDMPFDINLLPVQARSDILRVRLLRQHGGAWVDATLLPLLPLDRYADVYTGKTGFFAFAGPPSHWRLGNFFLIAHAGNAFIRALDDAIRAYWTHPRQLYDLRIQPTWPPGKKLTIRALLTKGMGKGYLDFFTRWRADLLYPVSPLGRQGDYFPYFWEQYLMMQLIDTDPKARAIVEAMTYRHHDLCHMVQNAREHFGPDFVRTVPMALRCSPVQKLDWRVDWPPEVFALPAEESILI